MKLALYIHGKGGNADEAKIYANLFDDREVIGFDYKALSALCGKAKQITDAVQSTLGLSELDCSTCSMKPVCDEIDGLRELHLKREGLTMEGNN